MGIYNQKLITKRLSPVLATSRIHLLTKPFYSGLGSILMFHRVIPPDRNNRIHNHLSLEISPDHLENIILFFKKRNYHFIKLDNLSHWLSESNTAGRKFVIFTFDDGYKDNLEYAYPVLKRHKVPFTIYVTSIFPERKAIFWWYIIENILQHNSHINYSFSEGDIEINCSSHKQKENTFMKLRQIITGLDQTKLEMELTGFFNHYGYDIYAKNDTLPLNWNEIEELSGDELVTIGSHTINHYNLPQLPDSFAQDEITRSKQILETKIRKRVDHFSYPLGHCGEREIEYVKRSGYHSSTIIKNANVFADHLQHLYTLPRFSINSLTTADVLTLHTNGFFPSVLNNFNRIVV